VRTSAQTVRFIYGEKDLRRPSHGIRRWSGRFGKKQDSLSASEIEPRFHGHEKPSVNGSERDTGHHREEKTTIVWPRQKDAGGENTKMNYGMDTAGEKEKRTSKKNVDGRSKSSHATRNLEPDQWRNREEWRLVSGRRRQLL
jgi:hypothetical protein